MSVAYIDAVQQIGDVAAVVGAVLATASVVVHATRPWRRSFAGRHLMIYMACIAATLDLALVRIAVGTSLDVPWFATLRVAVFLPMVFALGQRLAIQLRALRDDWAEQHAGPHSVGEQGPELFTPKGDGRVVPTDGPATRD